MVRRDMKTSVRLKITCQDAATAKKLLAVLSPDNRAFPKDQSFTALDLLDGALLFQAESERPLSVFSTMESILSDVQLFEEIWLSVVSDRERDTQRHVQ